MKLEATENSHDYNDSDESKSDSNIDDLTLDYLPNELKYTTKFQNDEADYILNGDNNMNKKMLIEFFRGITLCHQANVTRDLYDESKYIYIGVLNDEIATLDFC
jgi:hypothetical protein